MKLDLRKTIKTIGVTTVIGALIWFINIVNSYQDDNAETKRTLPILDKRIEKLEDKVFELNARCK